MNYLVCKQVHLCFVSQPGLNQLNAAKEAINQAEWAFQQPTKITRNNPKLSNLDLDFE